MTRIYLVRHAQAQGNVEHRFQGMVDNELTPLGVTQIEYLSTRFENIKLDAVYASPLSRTQKTAMGVIGSKKIALQIEPGIIEIDGGIFENQPLQTLMTDSRYAALYDTFLHRPDAFEGTGGETFHQVRSRMVEAVNRLAEKHEGQQIALVSHGCALRCYLAYADGRSVAQTNEGIMLNNTAVCSVCYDDNGHITIEYINDDSHLPKELRSFPAGHNLKTPQEVTK